MQVNSTSFLKNQTVGNKYIFNSFGCKGQNISPDIQWSQAPKDAKYFAVTIYDPDASTGSGWWHWVVFNIPAHINQLEEGASKSTSMPTGAIESLTDFGVPGYGGPCPPPGDKSHRYQITVYALKDKLDLDEKSMPAMVGFDIHFNTLDKASLTAFYGR